jgi:cob(I)alamin adenosyltransferase
MKIYTGTGDAGKTGLLGGDRVPKDHPRVASYGDVDELNAVLGLVRAQSPEPATAKLLVQIQRDLFALGAQLADPTHRVAAKRVKAAIPASRIRRLEQAIDAREKTTPPLRRFILPGGTRAAAALHHARTVCRRAERSVVALAREARLDPRLLTYLNRLSDLLFVLARHENHRRGGREEPW